MAEKHIMTLINRQTLIALSICMAGLILFVLFGIFPLYNASREAEAEILTAKAELERQKILHPLYIDLVKKKNQLPTLALALPETEPVRRENVRHLQKEIRDLALQNGMQTVSAVPDVSTMRRNSNRLLVVVDVKGDWMNLRYFLVQLGAMPQFDFMEKLTVKPEEEGKHFSLQVWFALHSSE